MKKESFKFEITLYFEGEDGYENSIDQLRKQIINALNRNIGEIEDIEIDLIERKTV